MLVMLCNSAGIGFQGLGKDVKGALKLGNLKHICDADLTVTVAGSLVE